jgi:hypothetical protein
VCTAEILAREVSDGVIAAGYEDAALAILRKKAFKNRLSSKYINRGAEGWKIHCAASQGRLCRACGRDKGGLWHCALAKAVSVSRK